MGISNPLQVASQITTPLALAGLAVIVLLILFRALIAKNILSVLDKRGTLHFVNKLMLYIFIITLVIAVLSLAPHIIVALRGDIGNTSHSQPQAKEFMTGGTNIAIANFGYKNSSGKMTKTTYTEQTTARIFSEISRETKNIKNAPWDIEVLHYDDDFIINTGDSSWDRTAEEISDQLGAHIIIYGHIEESGGGRVLIPKFYVSGLSEEGTASDEIVGAEQLGLRRNVPSVGKGGIEILDIAERVKILTLFTLGLTHMVQNRYDESIGYFEEAINSSAWHDAGGREVIHLFLGITYRIRNHPGGTDIAKYHYNESKKQNSAYSRAYIGLGNILYDEAGLLLASMIKESGCSDNFPDDKAQEVKSKLIAALQEYNNAKTASFKPSSANVLAKLDINVSNIKVFQAQIVQCESPILSEEESNMVSDLYTHARDGYLRVINQYNQGNPKLRLLASHAYFGLGIVYERGAQDFNRATEYYQKSLDTAGAESGMNSQAAVQLRAIRSRIEGR